MMMDPNHPLDKELEQLRKCVVTGGRGATGPRGGRARATCSAKGVQPCAFAFRLLLCSSHTEGVLLYLRTAVCSCWATTAGHLHAPELLRLKSARLP